VKTWLHRRHLHPIPAELNGYSERGMIMDSYSVRVTKDYLVFSAAHFITYGEGQCEHLHGHNYRVTATLHGSLDEHAIVYDFVILKERLRDLVNELDHRTLLPTQNPLLDIEDGGQNVTVRYNLRKYSFPKQDVVLLEIPNTTAEMLATWFAQGIRAFLVRERATHIAAIAVGVEESFGQQATFREEITWT